MATIKLKDESSKTFSIDGVCYTKGDYRLQYNAKKEVLIIPKAVANISNLSGLPFKNPTAWTYFVDLNDDPYGSFEEFSLAISDAINFNTGEATPQYKVYTAFLTQTGTNNPTALEVGNNTLGAITWARSGVGTYYATSSGLFTLGKTNYFISPIFGAVDTIIKTTVIDINNIYFQVKQPSGGTIDGKLLDTLIQIFVYE